MTAKNGFEKDLQALEQAVERLEAGDLSLEEALDCFETGVRSAERCREHLRGVEVRVESLLRDAGGELHSAPLDPAGGEREA